MHVKHSPVRELEVEKDVVTCLRLIHTQDQFLVSTFFQFWFHPSL